MQLVRQMKRFIIRLKSDHWIYLLLHLVLLFVGLILVVLGGTNKIAIGTSLIASAVAGWVLFLRIWLSPDELQLWELRNRFGLVRAYDKRSISIKGEYDRHLENVREGIDVIGFGLRSLREDYKREFSQWASKARVRILLLDPEFISADGSIANQRDIEEGDTPGTISRDVRAFVSECASLLGENQHFEVRLYRCLPLVNIFRIDGILFWGPYLVGEVSRNLPTFLTAEGGVLYKTFLDHFNAIWGSGVFSRPVPSEWLSRDATASDS